MSHRRGRWLRGLMKLDVRLTVTVQGARCVEEGRVSRGLRARRPPRLWHRSVWSVEVREVRPLVESQPPIQRAMQVQGPRQVAQGLFLSLVRGAR